VAPAWRRRFVDRLAPESADEPRGPDHRGACGTRNASSLGKQHAERINATLDDIEARFGLRGREAVKRAAEQIANTFARELYHEIIRLLSPLAMSAERLRSQLSADDVSRGELHDEAVRIGQRVTHLRAVLNSMRAYWASQSDRPRSHSEPAYRRSGCLRADSRGHPDVGSGASTTR
jgi:hypothetical protein